MQSSGRDDDFPGVQHFAPAAAEHPHPHDAPALHNQATDQGLGMDRQVAARAGRGVEVADRLLIDNEVDFEFAWNGRVYGPKQKGAPVDFHFNQAVLDGDALVIPKGHPNKKWSMEFIAHMMTAEPQAELARHIPYGPTNVQGNALLGADVLANLPSSPDNLPKCVFQNVGWWAENGQARLRCLQRMAARLTT